MATILNGIHPYADHKLKILITTDICYISSKFKSTNSMLLNA